MLDNVIWGQSLYYLCFYFIIFSFLGCLMETILCSASEKEFVNRGFLNGPFCPIYGTGMCIIIAFLRGVQNDFLCLFLAGTIIASMLEYIVGMFLEHIFNAKWWDYSDKPFNLQGRICLQVSFAWGLLCVLMMTWVLPIVNKLIEMLNYSRGKIIIYSFFTVLSIDTIVTVYNLFAFNRVLEELSVMKEDIAKIEADFSLLREKLKERFEMLAENFYNDNKMKELRQKIVKLRGKYHAKINKTNIIQRRIIYAFPRFRPKKHYHSFQDLRKRLRGKK